AKSLSKEIPSTRPLREDSREGPEARGSSGWPRIGHQRRDRRSSGSETIWHSERSGEEGRSSREVGRSRVRQTSRGRSLRGSANNSPPPRGTPWTFWVTANGT